MLNIFLGLSAAFSWTIACFLWRKQAKYFTVKQINLIKTFIASLAFIPFLFAINFAENLNQILILTLSGLIGITLGDCFYLNSLKRIGTRNTLSVEAFSPVLATIFGSIFIGETIPAKLWIGGSIVALSLFSIAHLKPDIRAEKIILNDTTLSGYIYAFMSIVCAVIGATLSRIVLINSDLTPFQTTEVRLISACFFLFFITEKHTLEKVFSLSNKHRFKLVIPAILGTNLGILTQQYIFKVLPLGLGWILLSSSPLFALFFTHAEGERVNSVIILLTLMAFSGVVVAFL